VHSTLEEVTGFLERHPPFSRLTPGALSALAGTAEIEYFQAGATLLAQDGPPAEHLYVVHRGAVELLDEGQVVDVLEEGESFGHASLLSGLPPSFSARAREDTLCYLFDPESARSALSEAEGVRFVAATLRSRLEGATSRAHRATPWGTAHVGAKAGPALVSDPDTPIRDVAARMTDGDFSCAVLPVDSGFRVVTDRDLREHVATGEVSVDAPISSLAGAVTPAIAPDRLALDALVDMLDADVEHLVVVDGAGALVGVVNHDALLELDQRSPLVVRQDVLRAHDVESVARAVADLPLLALRLLDASVEALDVLDVLTTVSDAVTRRLAELALAELGPPPADWAWLTLGSAARREQTLATDQDNGLAYEGEGPEIESYFAGFADRVNTSLARCGYAECRAGVMARNPGWRLSRAGWTELYESWLRMPTIRNVQLAMIGFDLRPGVGPLHVEHDLEAIVKTLPRQPDFLDALARASVSGRPPLGFLRGLVVESSGEHAGTLDIKMGGVVPIVDLARLHALAVGSTARRTTDRLRAAAAHGRLAPDMAEELEEAFVIVTRVRLEHQAAQIERGAAPDNNVDPTELPPLARRQLKEAFRAIARAQKAVDTRIATRIP
jgi:CBS domain-containing protein